MRETLPDKGRYPDAPTCCGPELTLWGSVDCCCNIALPSKIDAQETRRASVTFNATVNAKAEADDDASALGSGVPAAASSSTPSSDSDGKIDAQSDSSQTVATLQEQARALSCTKFTFRWKLIGYRDKARGRIVVAGAVSGDFEFLGPEGEVVLSRLRVVDTTAPIPVEQATAQAWFIDACGDRAAAALTLTRTGS